MPYVIVRMYEGRDEKLKSKLTDALFQTMQDSLGVPPQSLTIDIQEHPRPPEGTPSVPNPRAAECYYFRGKKQH
jgi:phenylpyruvate tautomerase PptA (4-oxalocrotonate tautomerase family)